MPNIPLEGLLKPVSPVKYIRRCTCCGTEYNSVTDFLCAPSTPLYRNNGGRMSVCRGCVDALYDRYRDEFGEEEAIRRICQKFDIYFNPAIVRASKNMGKYKSRMASYISRCNIKMYNGKTYDNTIREEGDLAIQKLEDLEEQQDKSKFVVTKQMVHDWGLNFSPSEYEFLENEYNDWSSKCVIAGKSKDALVRDLCIQRLQINKALLDGKIDIYTKMTETFQRTLDRAALTPKIEEANERASEIPLGVMIKNFEEHDPIPEPLDEWKDVDGIAHFYSVYFLGHLCKMMGIKNPHSELYEKEMAKYRVEIPELADADDEDVFDAAMSRITENGGDADEF